MPIHSRYSDEEIDVLLNEIGALLDKHQASTDLALMVLGNFTSYLINHRVLASHRQDVSQAFIQALQASIHTDKPHCH